MNCLEVEQLTVRFGGLVAVDNLHLTVQANSIHSLIGPNGAGKTTVINTIAALNPAAAGSVRFRSKEILGAPAHEISRAGVARTFQNTELFPEMTVLDNVLVGAQQNASYGWLPAMMRTRKFLADERTIFERARELLDRFGLAADTGRSSRICRSPNSASSNWRARLQAIPVSCCSTSPLPGCVQPK